MEKRSGQLARGLTAALFCSSLLFATSASGDESSPALPTDPAAGLHVAAAGQPPFSDYQPIIDRKPFGELKKVSPRQSKEEEAAEAQQAQQEQALARQIDMVAVNITPRGSIAVGFIDKTERPPRNYYVKVGETAGGYTVVDADFETEIATIEKDGVSITLKLGQGLVKNPDAGATDKAARPAADMAPAPQAVPYHALRIARTPRAPHAPTNSPLRASCLLRLRAKREERNRANSAELTQLREEIGKLAQSSEEAAKKRERAINLELISRGQQPLSEIQLTPEEDAELVRKGVLTEQ